MLDSIYCSHCLPDKTWWCLQANYDTLIVVLGASSLCELCTLTHCLFLEWSYIYWKIFQRPTPPASPPPPPPSHTHYIMGDVEKHSGYGLRDKQRPDYKVMHSGDSKADLEEKLPYQKPVISPFTMHKNQRTKRSSWWQILRWWIWYCSALWWYWSANETVNP